jgi:hypothetical protein
MARSTAVLHVRRVERVAVWALTVLLLPQQRRDHQRHHHVAFPLGLIPHLFLARNVPYTTGALTPTGAQAIRGLARMTSMWSVAPGSRRPLTPTRRVATRELSAV